MHLQIVGFFHCHLIIISQMRKIVWILCLHYIGEKMANHSKGNGLVNIPVSWSIWVGGGFKHVSLFSFISPNPKNIHFEIYHYIHVIYFCGHVFFRHFFPRTPVCFSFSEAGVLIPDLVPKVVMLMAALPCKQATIRNGPTKKGRGEKSPRFPTNKSPRWWFQILKNFIPIWGNDPI